MKHVVSCSAHLCHVFQYLSDVHIEKELRERKRDTNSQQEKKYDSFPKFVFPTFSN